MASSEGENAMKTPQDRWLYASVLLTEALLLMDVDIRRCAN
jgi:hypothetical protein